ncbi:MAG: 6-phosphofructokinase [Acidobacteria bacterium]|nr:6-phosphofructokinase [Acidobacteriota bacterium]
MRIGILTGGGDCPALNAVIRAAVKTSVGYGWEVVGIEEGFDGLVHCKTRPMSAATVSGILHLGGTILGTTNVANPFIYPTRGEDGKVIERDISDTVVANFKKLELDALIVIGGDGTLGIAQKFFEKGIPIVGVPKTIDNDIGGTVITFGFDTAVNTARDALDRLHTTAESHRRVMVVEVMGRHAGWIALHSGVAGGADVILIPEIPYDIAKVADTINERERRGKHFSIVVVAEGAFPKEGTLTFAAAKEAGREQRLGGVGERVANAITERTGKETRVVVLGHLQRGGPPTTFDRVLGTRFGAAAARLIKKGQFGRMVALMPPDVESVLIPEAIGKMKRVPPNSDIIESARGIGISFGD